MLKYYLFTETSIACILSYGQYKADSTCDVKAISGYLKQRLRPADETVSPYLLGGFTVQDDSGFSDSECGDVFSDVVVEAGAGCDFLVNETFAIVFEGAWVWGESTADDPINANGLLVTGAMKYYWF